MRDVGAYNMHAGACLQVARAGVARGIAIDGAIGFILLRVCYNKIRLLWTGARGYPLPLPAGFDESGGGAVQRADNGDGGPAVAVAGGDWPDRMMHAVTGRVGMAVQEDGSEDPVEWRNRAHTIYRCDSAPVDPVAAAGAWVALV